MAVNSESKRSTAVMRELRKSKDYRKKEGMQRILREIAKGVVPRPRSLNKYYPHITLEKVNQIRKEKGFPPIDDPKFHSIATKSIQTLALEINDDSKKELERLEREKTYKLKESVDRLETEQQKMKEKYKGKFVDIPREELFHVDQIMNYYTYNLFRMPNGIPKSKEVMKIKYGQKYN